LVCSDWPRPRLAVYRQKHFLCFYLRARTNFLQTSDNHAIAIFQTFRDQPFIANRLSGGDLAVSTLSPSPTTIALASPRGVRVTPCCGTSRRLG
jgi:hypothetical protein